MFLIVGLGNPGDEYRGTRHNIGFLVADRIAERTGVTFSERKFKARIARGSLSGQSCILMKPQVFMNLSGESVGPCAGYFQIPTDHVLVVHDDIDLPLGRLRIKKGGGHGGHNGLRSIIQHLPDAEFIRIRLGVGRPPPGWDGADYVLGRFASGDLGAVGRLVDQAAEAAEEILDAGLAKAMNVHNRIAGEES